LQNSRNRGADTGSGPRLIDENLCPAQSLPPSGRLLPTQADKTTSCHLLTHQQDKWHILQEQAGIRAKG